MGVLRIYLSSAIGMPSSLAEILICAGSLRRAGPGGVDSVMSPQFTLSLSHQEGPRTGQERHSGAGGAPRGRASVVRGLTRPGWCWWDSCGGPGRGRVQICCKGAPGRDRLRMKARNVNDSSPAPRRDRGLCNRFGQTAPPWTPGWAARVATTAPGRPPDAETCTSHSNMQFQPSFSSAKCTSRRGRGQSRSSWTAAQIPLRNIFGDPVGKAQ